MFADSSAIVKRYAEEAGSEDVGDLGTIVVSALTRVEVPSALWRKQREGALAAEDAGVLTGLFESDYHGDDDRQPELLSVEVTGPILEEAARMAALHALRALDAVQLATAVVARAPATTRAPTAQPPVPQEEPRHLP